MKALILVLALALAAQTPAIRPSAPVAPAPAAPAKPAPAKPAPAPPPSSVISPSDALALCRSSCAQTHFRCLETEDDTVCNLGWLQCRAKCARTNPG
jgi:hypothetical protein